MSRFEKHSEASNSGERIDFNFSNFQALQVPKGWDQLFVSIISVETGKTIAKSNKAFVHNGSCRWTDTLSESIWISQDGSSKELEECSFKLVIAMGSARSGILGEAIIKMAGYMSSKASVPVSLPLKKCNYGTTLQVRIHCLTPRTKLREEVLEDSDSSVEDLNADLQDLEIKSNGSDNSFSGNIRSSSSKVLAFTSRPREHGSRVTRFSTSGSDSEEDDSMENETFLPRIQINGENSKVIGRQNSNSSIHDSPRRNRNFDGPYRSNQSSFNSNFTGSRNNSLKHRQELEQSSSRMITSSSSKNLLETAEDTIEDLRVESKKWERNSRKLMVDLEVLKKEFSDQSKKQADLDMELSAAYVERDGLKNEVEKMKLMMEGKTMKGKPEEVLTFESGGRKHIQMELESEVKFQRESIDNLALQLRRSQESNVELVNLLQELEGTIEKQKDEIKSLSLLQLKVSDMEKLIDGNSEENRKLLSQLQNLQESEKKLLNNVELLKKALEEKKNEEEKLRQTWEMESRVRNSVDLGMEVEVLKGKLQELERDCSELTDENMELLRTINDSQNTPVKKFILFENESALYLNLFKQLRLAFHNINKPWSNISSHIDIKFESNYEALENVNTTQTNVPEKWAQTILNCVTEMNKLLEAKTTEFEEVFKHRECQIKEMNEKAVELQKQLDDSILKENNLQLSIQVLGNEMDDKRSEIEKLTENLLVKDNEIGFLIQCQRKYEEQVSDLLKEKQQLEETMEIVERESKSTSKCMDDLRNDLVVLSSSVDSHVSCNKALERKSSELESRKNELDLHLADVEKKNVQLVELVSGLEAKLGCTTEEREFTQLELENCKSISLALEDETRRLKIEIEIQNLYLKQRLQDMHSWLLGAKKESDYLKMENQKLESLSESLTEKCSTLQESNEELNQRTAQLEAKLMETELRFSDCSKRVETLEENLAIMLEDFDAKEKRLTSELDERIRENREQKEQLFQTESLLDHIENLKSEVEHLKNKISAAHDERERISSESLRELTSLRAEKAELEFSLQEVKSQVEFTEKELDIWVKSDLKVQELKADQERKSKLLVTYRSREGRLKTAMNDLELKLTLSEYERQQLVEETANLKVRLQEVAHLEEEVLGLKSELNAAKLEKENLEASLKSVSEECKEAKAQNISFSEKLSEHDDCKRNRIALEEKVLQMEGNLIAENELKDELSIIKREKKQFQRNIQQLEEEKNECLKRVQALEEELRLIHKQEQGKSGSRKIEMAKNISQRHRNKTKPSANSGDAQELQTDCHNSHKDQLQVEIDTEYDFHDETPRDVGVDCITDIPLLKNELAEALEANDSYETQLQSHESSRMKSTVEGEVAAKERYERSKSSLQTELRDLLERYSEMSLKYAEVEAERQDLVMKLKEARSGKKWFS